MEIKELKILALIGARSGSKGVPDKNIRELAGNPLMAWIIETAKNSKYVNRVIVSTDSLKYAETAKKYGAEIPFLRPKELAADNSPEFDFVKYTLEQLKRQEGYEPDIVVRLLATVPMQMPEDIDNCLEELLKDPKADSAVVVAPARQHPMKALKLKDDGAGGLHLVTYNTESGREVTPIARQNYEKAYFRANIIACRRETIFKTNSLTGDFVRYHIIPEERAVDIDSLADFALIENSIGKYKNIEKNFEKEAAYVPYDFVKNTLSKEPTEGKNLLEPFKSLATEKNLPFKILEDSKVKNLAELHFDEGDLWCCIEGEAAFVCGGSLVNPRKKKNPDGAENPKELLADGIEGGKESILKAGDWLWIPPGVPHQHSADFARMFIIKVPKKL